MSNNVPVRSTHRGNNAKQKTKHTETHGSTTERLHPATTVLHPVYRVTEVQPTPMDMPVRPTHRETTQITVKVKTGIAGHLAAKNRYRLSTNSKTRKTHLYWFWWRRVSEVFYGVLEVRRSLTITCTVQQGQYIGGCRAPSTTRTTFDKTSSSSSATTTALCRPLF